MTIRTIGERQNGPQPGAGINFHSKPFAKNNVAATRRSSGRRAGVIDSLGWMILLITSLLVITVFALLGQYAYPSADDFCMVANARDYGLFNYLWQHYFDWSGRYTGNALYGMYPTAAGLFAGYPWIAPILMLLLWVAVADVLSTLFHLARFDPLVWLIALIFVGIYLLGLRHTASSLYWLAGAMTYLSANILLLVTLALILRLIERQRHGDGLFIAWTLASMLVLGVGTNEINMIVLALLMGGVYLVQRFSNPARSGTWLWLLLVTLACFAVVYFSPGNTAREVTFPLRHDLLHSIGGSLRMGGWTLVAWMGNPLFVAASLLMPFVFMCLYQRSNRQPRVSIRMILTLLVTMLGMPFLLQFPAWWAMGGWPPPRTVDAIFFVFLISWSSLLGVLTLRFLPESFFYREDGRMQTRASVMLLVVSLLFALAVATSSRFQRALGDLFDRAPSFHRYMILRHQVIEESIAAGTYSLQVPAYHGEVPRSIYFNDIRPNWRDWRNVCYARYFGLRAIQRDRGPGMDSRQRPLQDAPL